MYKKYWQIIEDAHSETRNPLLMNYLRDFEITEQRARGIRTIKNSLKSAGLAEPKFEHRADWWKFSAWAKRFVLCCKLVNVVFNCS